MVALVRVSLLSFATKALGVLWRSCTRDGRSVNLWGDTECCRNLFPHCDPFGRIFASVYFKLRINSLSAALEVLRFDSTALIDRLSHLRQHMHLVCPPML
ncbi:hypothetical protein CPB84DRAFT_1534650 [Gymnopilus junonius]|uniref:Secreted protein n=1 Tax=Gymnopilus junonius TaxID=109634 RepID=A0A9P5NJD1_GYMJU|nr:hypothetical protein CPB84DRAFT_1534650 [Gymnopilus junonius]